MIVVAELRSGGTKFCMDLSEKTGMPFIGEPSGENLHGYHYDDTFKAAYHETKFQPKLSFSDMFDDNNIVLANKFVIPYLRDASYLILRKSFVDGVLSLCNIKKRIFGYFDLFTMTSHFETRYAIISFALEYDRDVLWYEDFDYAKPVNVSHLDKSDISLIHEYVDNFQRKSDLHKKEKQLLTFTT